MESIIGLYKTECVRPGPFHTSPFKALSDVEYATMAWVDWFGYAGDLEGSLAGM
jgi:putative transposase